MEGPSLVIATEEFAPFVKHRVVRATGTAKIDFARLRGNTLRRARSWGKHFLLEFDGVTVRVHFLMFGSYRIDDRREGTDPRMSLGFGTREVNFYSCAVKLLEGAVDEQYDWSRDVMSTAWDPVAARARVRARPDEPVCDVLMDQDVFAGVGNIIKNEVLFTLRLHPETRVDELPARTLVRLVDEAAAYSHRFYSWKKKFELRKHWQVFRKRTCPVCGGDITRRKTGKLARVSHFCEHCQPKR